MNLEIVGSENDTLKLRQLLDTVETQVRALKALGVSAESYGGLLASILLNKLPPEVRLIVSRGLTSDNWELDKLVELFEAELDARERTMASRPKKTSQGRNPQTSQTLNTPTSPSCVYCGQNHSSANCLTVSTVEARKQSLRRSGRCYICLKRNHVSCNCRSARCSQCRDRHHVSICQQQSGEEATTTGMSTTPAMYVGNKVQVMLQTATIVVHGCKGSRPTYCARAVLDCGSQRMYLTSRVQQTLSLPTTHTEMVEIRTFGATEGIKRPCNVVDINIITRDGCTQRMSALVVPHICDAIASPFGEASIRRYPHSASLDLADRLKPASANIDILIGADYYWSLVSGRDHLVLLPERQE